MQSKPGRSALKEKYGPLVICWWSCCKSYELHSKWKCKVGLASRSITLQQRCTYLASPWRSSEKVRLPHGSKIQMINLTSGYNSFRLYKKKKKKRPTSKFIPQTSSERGRKASLDKASSKALLL